MAKGTVNKVILVGRLGSDPEVRYTPGGSPVANFSIATDHGKKDKDGNWQTETTWHRIVLWNRQAEIAKEYVKKGHRIYVEGRIQTRTWEDQNGQKHYVTEIVGSDIQLLESAGQRMETPAASTQEPPANLPTPGDLDTPPDDVPF
jgi:single-strand DNA-binding protein